MEYAYRHAAEYTQIFWTSAASREALVSGYSTIAGLLNLPEHAAEDQTLAIEAVRRAFASQRDWLLILDNADDIPMVRPFLPEKNGHVLLTTRAHALGPVARLVEIKEMETEEGALFLLRRAGLATPSDPDREFARYITRDLLDGLPLALDQAGAFIEETGCGLTGYISLYKNQGPKLLKRRGALAPGHPDPVATTWVLSFDNIEKADPAAADLLRLCASSILTRFRKSYSARARNNLGPCWQRWLQMSWRLMTPSQKFASTPCSAGNPMPKHWRFIAWSNARCASR